MSKRKPRETLRTTKRNTNNNNRKNTRTRRFNGDTIERIGGLGGLGLVQDTPPTVVPFPTAKPLTKRFRGKAKKGEIRNPHGRKKGSKNRLKMYDPPDIKDVRNSLISIFQNSRARGILAAMLDFRLPPGYAELYANKRLKFTTMVILQNKRESNFWKAMKLLAKLFPKEIGMYGRIEHAHTLTGMVKRATKGKKSPKVLNLIEQKTEEGLTEYKVPEERNENEDERGKH